MNSKQALALRSTRSAKVIILMFLALAFQVQAQTTQPSSEAASTAARRRREDKKEPNSTTLLIEELRQMRQVIERLEKRVSELEAEKRPSQTVSAATETNVGGVTVDAGAIKNGPQASDTAKDRQVLDFFQGTTFNLMLDGYYGYNFNKPVGRINLLRAYDVLSNSFSLNQAALIIEHAPDVKAGRRFGLRLDLQYGQATETLQGNPANELRPQV